MNKKIVFGIIAAIVIILVAYFLLFEVFVIKTTPSEEQKIRHLVLADIGATEAKVSFENIKVKENALGSSLTADVNVMLNWEIPEAATGVGLCVGYNYKLSKTDGEWKIDSKEQTIVC